MALLPSLRPLPSRRPELVLRIAHRGGVTGGEGDYTDANLQTIAAKGAHLLEFDLQVTADDQLVVHHDPTLYAGHERPVWLADHTLTELSDIFPARRLPTAAEVIEAARKTGIGLYIDIKTITDFAAKNLLGFLREHAMLDRVILASARSDIVARCTALAPDLPRSVLFGSIQEEPVQLAESVGAHFIHPCWEVQPRPDLLLTGPWLDRVRALGLGVICWHEERLEVLRGLYALGVDGICTDDPDFLAQVAAASAQV